MIRKRVFIEESNQRLNTILRLQDDKESLKRDLADARKLINPINNWSDDEEDCDACGYIETDFCPYHLGKMAGQIAVTRYIQRKLEEIS